MDMVKNTEWISDPERKIANDAPLSHGRSRTSGEQASNGQAKLASVIPPPCACNELGSVVHDIHRRVLQLFIMDRTQTRMIKGMMETMRQHVLQCNRLRAETEQLKAEVGSLNATTERRNASLPDLRIRSTNFQDEDDECGDGAVDLAEADASRNAQQSETDMQLERLRDRYEALCAETNKMIVEMDQAVRERDDTIRQLRSMI